MLDIYGYAHISIRMLLCQASLLDDSLRDTLLYEFLLIYIKLNFIVVMQQLCANELIPLRRATA